MHKEVSIWQPISFEENWLAINTSKLDDIAPSWIRKREQLRQGSSEYEEFVNRLKRQHAIETGIVEKLYDLKEGITQTFIKEGFVESYLQHGDTNISPKLLMSFLKSHFEAIDFVFEVVKQERKITKGFILELHQLLTEHQDTTDAIDSFGNFVKIKLLKGRFKEFENNPKRADGTIFLYCPPVHVDAEIDKLIEIYERLESEFIKPIIISAWLHHAFTKIHPFQDGNGRLARLLATLVLLKHGLFPFTVKGNEKKKYIDGLELADKGDGQKLVDYFCEVQTNNIKGALNIKLQEPKSLKELSIKLNEKIKQTKSDRQDKRQDLIGTNRTNIFRAVEAGMQGMLHELQLQISSNIAEISMYSSYPEHTNNLQFSEQILEFALANEYYFNRSLPRAWFRLSFAIAEHKQYWLVLSAHHFGYDDSTMAIGAILYFVENTKKGLQVEASNTNNVNQEISTISLDMQPHIISLEAEIANLENNMSLFVQEVVTLVLAQIVSEIV
jgi:Fic family protein